MTIKFLTPVALVATFGLAAAPAYAGQHHGGGGHSGVSSHGGGASRGGGGQGGTASRGGAPSGSHAVDRGSVRGAPRIVSPGGAIVGRPAFYGPYYRFRPRLSLGFGLWLGYPVAYPYYYGYPYGYAYPYPADPYAYGYAAPSYGYPAQPYSSPNPSSADPPSNDPSSAYPADGSSGPPPPSVSVQRGVQPSAPGGISFEITPDTAAVFVDGVYVGTAGTFGPMSQPLGLIAGRHTIEIRASGYRTMTFDAEVTPGQVIPYQGTLQPN